MPLLQDNGLRKSDLKFLFRFIDIQGKDIFLGKDGRYYYKADTLLEIVELDPQLAHHYAFCTLNHAWPKKISEDGNRVIDMTAEQIEMQINFLLQP